MPKMAPQAACTPTEKSIMDKIAIGSEVARPSQTQKIPPEVCKIQRVHNRPLIPKNLAEMSDAYPPSGRAKKLAIPKLAAIIPAVCSSS